MQNSPELTAQPPLRKVTGMHTQPLWQLNSRRAVNQINKRGVRSHLISSSPLLYTAVAQLICSIDTVEAFIKNRLWVHL